MIPTAELLEFVNMQGAGEVKECDMVGEGKGHKRRQNGIAPFRGAAVSKSAVRALSVARAPRRRSSAFLPISHRRVCGGILSACGKVISQHIQVFQVHTRPPRLSRPLLSRGTSNDMHTYAKDAILTPYMHRESNSRVRSSVLVFWSF